MVASGGEGEGVQRISEGRMYRDKYSDRGVDTWWSTQVPPSLGVVTARLKVRASAVIG